VEDGLAATRSYAASAFAAERRLGGELAQERTAIEFWHNKVRAAMTAQREDMARLALARKKEHETLAADLAAQHAAPLETSTQVRASLRKARTLIVTGKKRSRPWLAIAVVCVHCFGLAR
jgi:phage shock protein A